ncbi:hypothetical protein GRJ2_001343700 [Grus japonensis]|uniref:Uncharacterized protein n=1 Tax=Grus japonensis TaxID=30415 RepID=A0ABC9WVJ4_GRUJA
MPPFSQIALKEINQTAALQDSGNSQLRHSLSNAGADILSIAMRIELSPDLITGSGLLAFGAGCKREVKQYQGP